MTYVIDPKEHMSNPAADPGRDVAYFEKYELVEPPESSTMSVYREFSMQMLATATILLGFNYLWWRWTDSLNPDAPVFSHAVLIGESLGIIGLVLFFYDIWSEQDTIQQSPPVERDDAALDGAGSIKIDLFIATYDEDPAIVRATIQDAKNVIAPRNVEIMITVLDDGDRPHCRQLAIAENVNYLSRKDNRGFKAGNLKNALLKTTGDFILICDADTRLFPEFLNNTLGYFRDPDVAWVQTPHWFYDVPNGWAPGFSWSKSKNPFVRHAGKLSMKLRGTTRRGADPFGMQSQLFFDVIQRRRNRNGASFCCGAGSIHRREAIFEAGLATQASRLSAARQSLLGTNEAKQPSRTEGRETSKDATGDILPAFGIQPFRFHVSEDILTSIDLHGSTEKRWKSVYHPHIESRMLSTWSIEAWAKQKLKYASGTFDIFCNFRPLTRKNMSLWTRLHYVATFWSYLSALWMPIFVIAPVISLLTGIAPVAAYSVEFFMYLLPFVLLCEVTMIVACKEHDVQEGRVAALAALPINLRAFWSVLRGRKPGFAPTPKGLGKSTGLHFVMPNIVLVLIMVVAGVVGMSNYYLGVGNTNASFLAVNMFWLLYNMVAMARPIWASLWDPNKELKYRTFATGKPA